jgi:hypothetical protein
VSSGCKDVDRMTVKSYFYTFKYKIKVFVSDTQITLDGILDLSVDFEICREGFKFSSYCFTRNSNQNASIFSGN